MSTDKRGSVFQTVVRVKRHESPFNTPSIRRPWPKIGTLGTEFPRSDPGSMEDFITQVAKPSEDDFFDVGFGENWRHGLVP